MKGDPVMLTVVAESPDGGTLSYQWWSADAAETEGTKIDGETSASYKIKKVEKTLVYYVVVTNTKDGVSNSKTSDKITITMTEKPADVTVMKPVIIEDLPEKKVLSTGKSDTLKIVAESPDGGTLSYQWYSAKDTTSAGQTIPGKTSAEYTVEMRADGATVYYYVVVTNTKSGKTKQITSGRTAVILDKNITVTLDIKTVSYDKFDIKEMKFRDGSAENKTFTVPAGTTLAELVYEHEDCFPVATITMEYADDETTETVEVYVGGTFWDKNFSDYHELDSFLEEHKNAVETTFYKPLDSDCTFYAYVASWNLEIYETEDAVALSKWSQNMIPFYIGDSKTSWILYTNGWVCYYAAAATGESAQAVENTFVELKPTVCRTRDERKALKVQVNKPGLYGIDVENESGWLSNGDVKLKIVPALLEDDLYFVGGATSWDFSHLEPFNEDDEFTFVAASAEGEFKVSTYEWGMRFTNNSDVLSPGQSVPLTLCGVADEGKDENAKFSGLIAGATYTAVLERDSSGVPTAISLRLEDVQFTEKLYFVSDFSLWVFDENTIQDSFKDNEYAFVAHKTEGSFKVTTSDWGLRFANDSEELTPSHSIPLTLCGDAGEGKDNNGTISGLTQDELYRVILTRDETTRIPISISLEKIPQTLYFVGTATSWDFTEAPSFNSENKVTFTFSPKANETEIEFKISTDGWIKQFSVAGGRAEISSSEPTEVRLTRISGGAANGILSGLEAGKTYNVTVTLDNPTNPTKMTVECISQS